MIENRIVLKPIFEIKVNQEDRQRALNNDKVIETARSIATRSLFHPVIVNKVDDVLIAGAHRIAAFQFNAANNVPCHFPSYKNWIVIPVRYAVDCNEAEVEAIELEENIKRSDMTWQEEAEAFARFHSIMTKENPEWTGTDTANALGCSSAFVSKRIQVAAELRAGNPRITACTGVTAALNIINRQNDRLIAQELEMMAEVQQPSLQNLPKKISDSIMEEGTEEELVEADTPRIIPAEQSIILGNFKEWVQQYRGPVFNFLHCDFPYGINHQDSEQGRGENHGTYEDSPEVYWELLHTLASVKDSLLTHSCHIMFWLSGDWDIMKETREFFSISMPDFEVQSFPMIWHKTDNKGLLPDPNRYGRRTYETALLLTRGDRKIVGPVALSYGAPTGHKEHLSMKPEPMLRHFFRMFVDEYTWMLDPTCGSGTSLRAAESLGASQVLGLEIDPENHEKACSSLNQARKLKALEA